MQLECNQLVSNMTSTMDMLLDNQSMMKKIEDELPSLHQQFGELKFSLCKPLLEPFTSSKTISTLEQGMSDINVLDSPQYGG